MHYRLYDNPKDTRDLIIKHSLILCFFAALSVLAVTLDRQEVEAKQSLYCEMTAIFKQTDGQYGWPEYDKDVKCDE